jgi:lipid-A-disaccharide synthase
MSRNDALRVMIVAGDPSGDIHASRVVTSLKERVRDCEIFGIGGDRMVSAGFETVVPVEKMAVMGFIEVLRHLKFFIDVNKRLLQELEERQPRVIVLVDYPGFNIRFAQRIRRYFASGDYQPKLMYYISPQVWAWKPGRIRILANTMDFMAVVFPFEEQLYQKVGLPVEFVGHPLLDQPPPRSKQELIQAAELDDNQAIIALLPGSRLQEVHRHLPIFYAAFDRLHRKHPELVALVAASETVSMDVYQRLIPSGEHVQVMQGWTREIMAHSRAACVVSGTATVETALFGTPSVIAYKASPVTYWIAKRVVQLPHIGMVNILAREKIVEELIQSDATPERLDKELERLLYDEDYRSKMIGKLHGIRKRLGEPGAGQRVADKILELADVN